MIKNFLSVCFLFLSFHVFSQDVEAMKSSARFSSDLELTSYINKAKSSGLSLIEVEELINAQGATTDELSKLRALWNTGSVNFSSSVDILPDSPESSFGTSGNTEIIPKKSRRFGSSFFENKNINEVPQLFIATPSDYRLGPGDELIINLYGASENSYSVQISRNGTVKFDRLAPIYLSGLSINSAKLRLKNRLSKLYSGLVSDDKLSKVDIDLSLQKARSVVINITGQVIAPGTYTISGFSSVLNALFAAGGPNEVGSFRNIKLLRNGKINKIIDLYDYFVKGIYPNVYLRDQDVILVDAYTKQVEVSSGLKTNALYELKENETVEDVLSFAGGFSSNSYKDKLFVNRIDSYSRSVVEISKSKFSKSILNDGDIINAKTVSDFVTNSISIQGAVFIPGIYDLFKVSTVGELINASKGIMPDASSSSMLYRTNNGVEDEVISINLRDENDLKIKLFDQDRLVVFSLKDFEYINKISVIGEVNNPAVFDHKLGMTITDAIQLSNGFTDIANRADVKVIRNISNSNKRTLNEEFVVDFSDKSKYNKFKLLPDDIISVSRIPFFQPSQSYTVEGQVSVQNSYPISYKNYSVRDAFRDNIVLIENASDDGIYVERDSIKIPITGSRVSIETFEPESDLELIGGDIIRIPTFDNTISIKGSVQQESIISFKKSISFREAISSSGGITENADLKRAYVEYQNGLKKSVKSFLGIRNYPKVLPGSQIFVPEKPMDRNKTSVGEIVGYTTSLVSIIALLKSF
jgi:protein involved in polysaccharide export with SLBB domain